ncbi:MAG: hypothetical protein KDC84_14675 [Crocinitomicaceae bacterium]|nr:hypothetical protein [Crocinitomicaceae bacterium]
MKNLIIISIILSGLCGCIGGCGGVKIRESCFILERNTFSFSIRQEFDESLFYIFKVDTLSDSKIKLQKQKYKLEYSDNEAKEWIRVELYKNIDFQKKYMVVYGKDSIILGNFKLDLVPQYTMFEAGYGCDIVESTFEDKLYNRKSNGYDLKVSIYRNHYEYKDSVNNIK